MSWSEYVSRLIGSTSYAEVGTRVGTTGQTVGRWVAGTSVASPVQAVALARGYNDSPLNALVALGYITAQEAKQRPAAAPDFSQLTNDELLELVRARMRREDGEGHGRPAASQGPATGPGDQPVIREVSPFEVDVAARKQRTPRRRD